MMLLAGCDKGPKTDGAAPVTASAPAPGATASASTEKLAGTTFGAGVTIAETTPISQIVASPESYKGKTVRVEGTVTDVCERRGCWFELAGEAPGERLRFKVTDGEMVFPVDSKGKWAVAQGQLAIHALTLEETRAHAEEEALEKGEKLDPATITKPTVIVRLDGTGAVMRDKK